MGKLVSLYVFDTKSNSVLDDPCTIFTIRIGSFVTMCKCTWCYRTSTPRTWVTARQLESNLQAMTLSHWLPPKGGCLHIMRHGCITTMATGWLKASGLRLISAPSLWCLLTLRRGWSGILKTTGLLASNQKLKRKGLHSGVHALARWCYVH